MLFGKMYSIIFLALILFTRRANCVFVEGYDESYHWTVGCTFEYCHFLSKLFKKQFVQVEINFDNWKNIPVETSGTNLPEPISTFKDIGLG